MATLSSRDWREPKMIAIKIIGKLDAKRHSTTDIYDIEGELGTTMGRDHCEPKKIAIDIVGTLDPKRHSQMDILGAGGGIADSGYSEGNQESGNRIIVIGNTHPSERGMNGNCYSSDGVNPTLTTNKGEGSKVAIPVLTPDRGVKKQNGKRIREDGEPSYTLTAQEPQGVAVGVTGTVTQDEHPPIYVELENGHKAYCIWYPKKECYITVRRLTPREYFRLQGWADDYFDKAQFVNSDSQLYKQAGNAVTVQVVEAIGKKLKEIEEQK